MYDIVACHYTVLERLDQNLTSQVIFSDKNKRNITIGHKLKKNPELGKLLRKIVVSVIDNIIQENCLKDEDIILRQYDGIIVTKKLSYKPSFLVLKKYFSNFLVSYTNCNTFLAKTIDGDIDIKGIPDRYPLIDNLMEKLLSCNFSSKKNVFMHMKKIKNEIMTSNSISLFLQPRYNEKFLVRIKKYGSVILSRGSVSLLDHSEIDKKWYFKKYFDQFFKSLVLTFA